MKVLLLSLGMIFAAMSKAFANPACPVCTVAIVGSLTLARKLGVDDSIVGLWGGALLAMLGYWTIRFLEKRKWTFPGYKLVSMLMWLSSIGFLYIKELTYKPRIILQVFNLDPFLFSTLMGFVALILGVNFYAWMKAKNGGHAHFPFEKVVVPIALLALINVVMVVYPFCLCGEPEISDAVTADDEVSF
ncbi:MAG: hypothetical protein J6P93_01710 [Alphaproteobacteria bacterium]|nr:hypothetical protein [Alphaproteobacteria bacterium]